MLKLFAAKVMLHLAAVSDVREVGSDQYVHSKYSHVLASKPLVDALKYTYVHAASGKSLPCGLVTDVLQFQRLLQHMEDTPKWLAGRGWQHVNDPQDMPASFT